MVYLHRLVYIVCNGCLATLGDLSLRLKDVVGRTRLQFEVQVTVECEAYISLRFTMSVSPVARIEQLETIEKDVISILQVTVISQAGLLCPFLGNHAWNGP